MRNPFLVASLCALLAVGTTGCGLLYKVDVYQGNMLDERNVAQLREGMINRQVLSLLGTPSVRDPFHADRWDDLATISQRGSEPEVRNLVLSFNGDSLASIEGDYFPKQDNELRLRMARYGNLPREERQAGGR